ncbi:MAG: hypothetical protein WD771_10930 [Gemmatimonadaceae bacterium]
MRKEESSRIEALEALLAERRKHEGYLAKLEERRGGTPDAVYAKLRDEYLVKLTDAQVRAAAEAEALAGGLEDDETAMADAQERLAALEAEKLEGELRAAVGEFDPKEWTKKLNALKANIAIAEKERDSHLEVLERAQALLAEALATPEVGGGGAAPADGAPKLRPTAAMTGGPSFDELAFLKSVVGRNSTPTKEIPSGASQSKPDTDVEEPASAKPNVGGAAKGRAASAKPAAPVPSEPEPAEPSSAPTPEPQAPASAEPSSAPLPPAAAANDHEPSTNAFGKPTPRTSQAVKTLKCQECGTFNYPTEWYCERCGGELAAL